MSFNVEHGTCDECGAETVITDEYRFSDDSALQHIEVEQCPECGQKTESEI